MSGKGQLIDAVLQRQAAVSVIVGIQLVKLHQLLSHLGLLEGGGAVAMVTDLSRSSAPPQSSGAAAAAAVTWLTLAQWSLVDGAWLVGLFLVRIPRLRFSLAMTLLLMAGTVCLNAGIIGNLLRHSSSNEATRGADTPRLKNGKFNP